MSVPAPVVVAAVDGEEAWVVHGEAPVARDHRADAHEAGRDHVTGRRGAAGARVDPGTGAGRRRELHS